MEAVLLPAAVGAGVLAMWALLARDGIRSWARARRGRRLRARGSAAARDAALDDPAFDPARLQATVTDLMRLGARTWRGGATVTLDDPRWTPALVGWAQLRGRYLGRDAAVRDGPTVDVVHVINRTGTARDRVVVRNRWSGAGPEADSTRHFDERWTLVRGGGDHDWVVASIVGDPFAPALAATPNVSAPDVDLAELRHASLAELAADAFAHDHPPSALTGADGDAALRLLELGALDGRFMPALLESSIRRLILAWELATTGQDAPLRQTAAPAAAAVLLQRDDTRRVVRDAVLESWACDQVIPDAIPPQVVVDVRIGAISYAVDGHGRRAGEWLKRSAVLACWTLSADGPPEDPWRLIAASDRTPAPRWPRGEPLLAAPVEQRSSDARTPAATSRPVRARKLSDDDRRRRAALIDVTLAGDTGRIAPGALITLAREGEERLAELGGEHPCLVPAVLGSFVARFVAAWELATGMRPIALQRMAAPAVVDGLLQPGGAQRVLTDAVLRRWTPTRVTVDASPPEAEVAIVVEAVHRILDRPARRGDDDRRVVIDVLLTLVASGPAADPWRLVAARSEPRQHGA